MRPRTIPFTILLLALRVHLTFTLRRLCNHALTQALPGVLVFEQLLVKWGVIQQQELDLEDQVDDGAVGVAAADSSLDLFAKRVSNAILLLTGGNRTHGLYLHFFGGLALHEFIRQKSSEQLAAMAQWVSALTKSEHPSLVALGTELPQLIENATMAANAKAKAEQNLKDFREIGERKQFVDEVNSARKVAHGVLGTLPHKHPSLPLNFADQFFLRERNKNEEGVTLESLDEDIAALQAELTEKEALLKEKQDAEDAAAKKEAEDAATRQAAKIELEAIEIDLAAKQKRAEELRALL